MLSQEYPTEEYPYPRKGILSTHTCIPRDTILQLQYDWKFQEHPRTTLPWYWSQTSQNISRVICTYPLVNIQKTNWKITMLLMGKLTISMAMFNSFLYLYQAGYQPVSTDLEDPLPPHRNLHLKSWRRNLAVMKWEDHGNIMEIWSSHHIYHEKIMGH